MAFPGRLEQIITDMHGDDGRRWLARLPALVDELAAGWGVTVGEPYTNLTYNYVAPGTRADGTPVVLKLSYGGTELASEATALRLAGGHGMVPLLAHDPERGAMLIGRAVPGDTLHTIPDEDATRVIGQVMRDARQPVPDATGLTTVAEWGRGFDRLRDHYGGGTGPFPADLTALAERLWAHLDATTESPVVLHGDLHHDNVLRDGDGWRAIDPKGLTGDPAFDVGALMRNRLPDLADPDVARASLLHRLDVIAGITGDDPDRLRRWTIAQALLSAWWLVEDGLDLHPFGTTVIRTAELLARPDDWELVGLTPPAVSGDSAG